MFLFHTFYLNTGPQELVAFHSGACINRLCQSILLFLGCMDELSHSNRSCFAVQLLQVNSGCQQRKSCDKRQAVEAFLSTRTAEMLQEPINLGRDLPTVKFSTCLLTS